jgi:hypothetical protein
MAVGVRPQPYRLDPPRDASPEMAQIVTNADEMFQQVFEDLFLVDESAGSSASILPINLVSDTSGILPVTKGGTGLDASGVTDGQLLIGSDAGNGLVLSALTPGSNVSITNGPGTIEIAVSPTGGSASLTPIEVTANSSVDSNFGSMIPDRMEIDAGIQFEIHSNARHEISSHSWGTPFMTRVKLDNAQITKLNTNPVVIAPAPGPGFMVIPLSMTSHIVQTAGYNTSQNLRLRYHGSTTDLVTPAIVPTNASQDVVHHFAFIAEFTFNTAVSSGALEISLGGAVIGAAAGGQLTVYLHCLLVPND